VLRNTVEWWWAERKGDYAGKAVQHQGASACQLGIRKRGRGTSERPQTYTSTPTTMGERAMQCTAALAGEREHKETAKRNTASKLSLESQVRILRLPIVSDMNAYTHTCIRVCVAWR
jgi:hypothetical protein